MNKQYRFWFFVIVLVAACGLAVAAGPAQPLRIEPSRFMFELKPGEEVTGSIYVTNKGTETTTPKANLSDWSVDLGNGLVLQAGGTFDSTLNGWLKFNPRQFTLKAKDSQTVRFTIRVPRDAAPGERRGMITFEQSTPIQSEVPGASAQVIVTSTVYVAVLPVQRTCEIVQAQIVNEDALGQTGIVLSLKGTGNAHFRGKGQFRIFLAGEKTPLGEGDFEPLVVLPQVTTRFRGAWKGVLAPGKYVVAIRLTPEAGGAAPLDKAFEYTRD